MRPDPGPGAERRRPAPGWVPGCRPLEAGEGSAPGDGACRGAWPMSPAGAVCWLPRRCPNPFASAEPFLQVETTA